ncbi:LysR family transcriptional regulator [Microbacterium esteraromaticum]|uniref:LysR family transcriptional regulator n=1 Tax=Microbacterium esteraromaticum TaxID=57043 RepID=A0A7D8AEQ0_9MICO|nr:LysR family transcriptional regulator [Microbacterium esteraromaticum]QMU98064.1 LysR family transcriptional regulator [Microbacterium esteraromaticum]
MDLQQLRYVVEVASVASFTRAAERCFVTQSALSHQIAALERELGQRLFIRSSRSVRPTEAGLAFLQHARTALAAVAAAKEDAAAAEGRVVGTLRLGVIPTVAAVDIPAVIAGFRAEHPEVRVELTVGNSESLVAAVRGDELDAAFLGLRADVEPAGVSGRLLDRERLVAVLPPSHPVAGRARIRLQDIAKDTFADFPAGTSGRAQGDLAFSTAGLGRDVAFEAASAELLLGLVASGLAVCLLAPGVVSRSSADVVAVDIEDGPMRAEYLIWHEHAPRAVARAFVARLAADDRR